MTGRKRRAARRTARILFLLIAGLVSLVLLAVGGVLVGLHTDWGRAKVANLLDEKLDAFVNGDVSIGRLEGSLLGDFVARDLVVRDTEGRKVLTLDVLHVEYDPLALLDQNVDLDAVHAIAPTVYDRGNLGEILALPESNGQPSAWVVSLDDLRLVKGVYESERADAQPLTIDDIHVAASADIDGETIAARLGFATAHIEQFDRSVTVAGELGTDSGVLRAKSIVATAGDSAARVDWAVFDTSSGFVAASVSAVAEPRDLAAAVGPGTVLDELLEAIKVDGVVARVGDTWATGALVDGGGGVVVAGVLFDGENLRGSVYGSELHPGRVHRGAPPGPVDLSLVANVAIPADPMAWRGLVSARVHGRIGDWSVRDGEVLARGTDDFQRLEVSASSVGGPARLSIDGLAVDVAVENDGDGPARFSVDARAVKVPGQVAAQNIDLDGSLPAVEWPLARGRVALTSSGVRAQGLDVGPLAARVRLAGARSGRVEIEAGSADSEAALKATAAVAVGDWLKVEAGTLRLRTRDLVWRGELEAAYALDGPRAGAARVSTLALESAAGRLELAGKVGPARRRIDADLKLANVDLERLGDTLPELPVSLRGRVEGEASVSLPAMKVEARLEARGVSYEGRPPVNAKLDVNGDRNSLDAGLEVRGKAIGHAKLDVALSPPTQPLTPAAWIRKGRAGIDSIKGDFHALNLEGIAEYLPNPPDIDGTITGELEASDSLEIVRADLRLRRGLSKRFPQPLSAHAVVDVQKQQVDSWIDMSIGPRPAVRLAVQVNEGLRSLWTDGAEAWLQSPAKGRALITGIDLATIAAAAGQETTAVHGALYGQIQFEGTLVEPRGKLKLEIPRMAAAGLRSGELRVNGTLDRTRYELAALIRHRGENRLMAEAKGPLDFSEIDVVATLDDLRLGLFRPFARQAGVYRLRGRMDGSIEVKGTPGNPRLSGTLQLRKGGARMPGPLGRLRDVAVTLGLTNRKIAIQGEARTGAGRLDLDGSATLGQDYLPASAALRLSADEVPLQIQQQQITATTDLTLKGKRDDQLWKAELVLRDSELGLPPKLGGRELLPTEAPEDVVYASDLEDGGLMAASDGPWLRLDIRAENGIQLQGGREVRARAAVDLRLTMVQSSPILHGTVEIDSGRIRLFDRRYRVERASASFDGSSPPNPAFDVLLSHDFDEAVIFIEVDGTATDPRLDLRSEPPIYSRAEVLGFVLGGEPGGGGPGPGGASSAATSLLASGVESMVKKGLPVDTIQIGSGDGDNISHVTVGKWLSDDLFVAYRRVVDADVDENNNEARMEYELSRRWSLKGAFGDRGVGYLDLLWVKRY